MLIGYARVSSTDQNLDLQHDALKKAGCEKIYTDRTSGWKTDRPGLKEALGQLTKGDVLVIWKLDRLGRSVIGLSQLVNDLSGRGIGFQSLSDNVSTTTPAARAFFHITAAFAELERDLIRERTRAGLAAARERGRVGGRPRKMTPAKIEAAKKLIATGMPMQDVADAVGVSYPTLYHWLPASQRAESGVTA